MAPQACKDKESFLLMLVHAWSPGKLAESLSAPTLQAISDIKLATIKRWSMDMDFKKGLMQATGYLPDDDDDQPDGDDATSQKDKCMASS